MDITDPAVATLDGPCSIGPRRWKEAPLAQRLFILHNMMMRIGDRLVAPLGLTSSRWLLLGAVANRAEAPMLSDLSNDALLSLQNISRMVACMEADGLLERFTRPGTGRATYIRLTEKGREVHEKTKVQARRFAEAFLAGTCPAEIERLESELEHLIQNLEALEREVCVTPAPAAMCVEVPR
ncbi:MAG: MarR family transcriptional regulator [Phycisphaerae bacterium]|nr:MarR family transcriptional regulator [Phycisphaerae bacterium]